MSSDSSLGHYCKMCALESLHFRHFGLFLICFLLSLISHDTQREQSMLGRKDCMSEVRALTEGNTSLTDLQWWILASLANSLLSKTKAAILLLVIVDMDGFYVFFVLSGCYLSEAMSACMTSCQRQT